MGPRSKSLKSVMRASLAGVLLAAALALPAFAGSNSFGPQSFTTKYTTSNYETGTTGQHSINSRVVSCTQSSQYYVTLVRQRTFLPDYRYTKKGPNACGSTYTQRSWSVSDVGTFHHDIEKTGSGTTNGTYTWPS